VGEGLSASGEGVAAKPRYFVVEDAVDLLTVLLVSIIVVLVFLGAPLLPKYLEPVDRGDVS